mmetsp:Transcript_57873/g.188142  ORF Transcript_57873/g.188142 Transcript_57873/m.188142 type:complete len:282 (+) Transcript_57873:2259-3104(+)
MAVLDDFGRTGQSSNGCGLVLDDAALGQLHQAPKVAQLGLRQTAFAGEQHLIHPDISMDQVAIVQVLHPQEDTTDDPACLVLVDDYFVLVDVGIEAAAIQPLHHLYEVVWHIVDTEVLDEAIVPELRPAQANQGQEPVHHLPTTFACQHLPLQRPGGLPQGELQDAATRFVAEPDRDEYILLSGPELPRAEDLAMHAIVRHFDELELAQQLPWQACAPVHCADREYSARGREQLEVHLYLAHQLSESRHPLQPQGHHLLFVQLRVSLPQSPRPFCSLAQCR